MFSRNYSVAAGMVVIFLIGYTVGQFVMSTKIQAVPLKIIEDTVVDVPVIELDGIADGYLEGVVKGEARVFLAQDMIMPNSSGAFSVPADALFVNYVRVAVPEDMRYVASKRGSNYYAVDSAAGARIVPENRMYFADEQSAQEAGFKRGK